MFMRLVNIFFPCLLLLLPVLAMAQTVGFLIPSSGLGDQSFNDMTYSGLVQSRGVHKFELIRESVPDFTEESRRRGMEVLLAKGADIVVVNGFEFEQTIRTFAPTHPDTLFIIHDIKVEGFDNVASTTFNQYQGACLAGVLAGWMSKTGKTGFIGGMDIPVIREFWAGFRWGVLHAAPKASLREVFLSDVISEGSGFDNPEAGYREAEKMYSDGVDIIFGAAGLSGNGIIGAAMKQGQFAIGVDADQDHMAKGHVLTSVMKRLDTATIDLLDRIYRGEKVSGVYSYGLKEGGISLTPMNYTRDIIPEEVLAKLEKLRQQLANGEIGK